MWTIKASSTSYRFLSRYHPDYRSHAAGKPGASVFVAQDMCSYYRTLAFTILAVLLSGITIIGVPYFLLMLMNVVTHSEGSLWLVVPQFITSLLGGLACAVTVVGAMIILGVIIVKYSIKWFYKVLDFFVSDDPNVTTKSLIKTWKEQKLGNYCTTVEYVKD